MLMTHTYLLIAAFPSSLLNVPEVTPKNFRRRLYNFLYLKLWGH